MTHSSSMTSAPQHDAESAHSAHKNRWSIGTQLLVIVNCISVFLVLAFLVYDYQKEMHRRLNDKRIALHEEAITIQSAVPEFQRQGIDTLQRYIDRVCLQMNEFHSPGHHIAIRIDDHVLQAKSHHRESDELLKAMSLAKKRPSQRGHFQGRDFIVGKTQRAEQSVEVLEFVDTLQRQVMRDSLRRFGGSTVLAILVALIVNAVLLRIVVRPLERLLGIVEQVQRGTFGGQVSGFRSRELSDLSRAINQMSHSLAESAHQRSLQMAKARRIQQNLLPPRTELSNASVVAHFEPAEDVAGDFYDVRRCLDGSWIVFLADVTGHGIPAAMNATLLKAHLAEACGRFIDPLEIMRHVNRRFTQQTLPEDFATCILVRHSPDGNTLQVVNAGHDAGLLRAADGQIHECDSSGLILGIDENADWETESLRISKGGRLLIFTDGVTETFGADETMFGRDRTLALLNETADEFPESAIQTFIQTLETFRSNGPQLDDVTMVIIDF